MRLAGERVGRNAMIFEISEDLRDLRRCKFLSGLTFCENVAELGLRADESIGGSWVGNFECGLIAENDDGIE